MPNASTDILNTQKYGYYRPNAQKHNFKRKFMILRERLCSLSTVTKSNMSAIHPYFTRGDAPWTNYHFAANICTHNKQTTSKALTRGRTDQFAAGVTYLRYPIQVCFSATLQELVFPRPLSLSAVKEHFPHVAVNLT